eukprot:CAMPEP_0116903718 /NCGR_PEP_ID=MMETSP0467-20121206/10921_1 /TAXON_ID=283647 /ORGANISM="Mesodinium pulex, Strain SPMC105" /LENGTH=60 /DNA_ID=CAMNT_0004578087 /DNA_START=398 /DNA_END=580 /DNA_ORIENTATION=+
MNPRNFPELEFSNLKIPVSDFLRTRQYFAVRKTYGSNEVDVWQYEVLMGVRQAEENDFEK